MPELEDYIVRNKDFFDQHNPKEGHEERFLKKLQEASLSELPSSYRLSFNMLAASVLIFLTIGAGLYVMLSQKQFSSQTVVNQITLQEDIQIELAQYDSRVQESVNKIDLIVSNKNEADKIKQMALSKLDDIEGSLALLEKEHTKNPDNEIIKETLLEVQRKKERVMDDILTQLDFANSSLF